MRRLWLLYLLLIFGLSSIPSDPRPEGVPMFADKVAHFVLYAGLGWLFLRLEQRRDLRAVRLILAATAVAALVGLADEFYQGYVPNRTREVGDWVADVTGGATGAVLALGMGRLERPPLGANGDKERAE